MAGIPGKFFKQFGWTAALAVFASLVVARVLTPMMAAYLMKRSPRPHKDPFWMPAYLRASRWALSHRWITLGAAAAFFVGSIALIPLLPKGFIPPDDNSQTQVYLELPPGATLSQTRAAAEAARQLLTRVDHIKSIYTTVGGGSAGSDPFAPAGTTEVRKATLTVLLTERGQRPRKQGIEGAIRAAMAELLEVDEDAGVSARPFGRKAEVRAEDEVDRVLAQAVLGDGDRAPEAPELVTEVARLIQEAQRMDVAGGLHDGQVDGGKVHGVP
jgi:multidrug efflux pump subunit AcrB